MQTGDATARTEIPTPTTDAAPIRADAAYAEGWMDAVRAARAARTGLWKAGEYFDGWLDAVTLQPVDPARLGSSKSYARGYAAGAKQYERAVSGAAGSAASSGAAGNGYDAE
jgi:hypothetical protein